MKGIKFIPKEEPSEEAKEKLSKLITDRDARIKKTVDKYRSELYPLTPEEAFKISPKKDLTKDLIIEMKQAIEWYMDNTTVMNPSRSYQETFHDLGMNLRMRAEDILNK